MNSKGLQISTPTDSTIALKYLADMLTGEGCQ